MTESERRNVVVVNANAMRTTVMVVPNSGIPVLFVLKNAEGTEIANSHSNWSLSNWAQVHGATEVVHRYDLRLGDDSR